jgi:hypothetical protein
MPRLMPLIKGMGSFVVPALRTSHKALYTQSADYNYSIFMRHAVLLRQVAPDAATGTVAELGPGSSFGVGFAALIAGAQKYYGLDLLDHSDSTENLRIFDDLVGMFARRAAIPAQGTHSRTFPDLSEYGFPAYLAGVETSGNAERMSAIRADIVGQTKRFFEVAAPWSDAHIVREGSVDWLISHSVLEHVDDLVPTYRDMALWLRPGAYATLLVDFYSHDLTSEWNGHWAVGEDVWRLIRGKRPYLINRAPLATHLDLASQNGLVLRALIRNKRFDGMLPSEFRPPFDAISDEDARTRMAFLVVQKGG